MSYNELSMRSSYKKLAHVLEPIPDFTYMSYKHVLVVFSTCYMNWNILLVTFFLMLQQQQICKPLRIRAVNTNHSIQCHIRMEYRIRVVSQRSL